MSRKDAMLLAAAPHLVLDGLAVAADALNAERVYLYVSARAAAAVRHALDEREAARWDRHRVTIVEAPDTFVAGEESAVVRRIEGGPAIPRDRTVVTAVSGVRGRPTLVNNVETLAHIALIARYGPPWFRSVGDAREPGTMLVTLSGALSTGGVVEVPTGARLADVIGRNGGTDHRTVRALLIGGYHGGWVPARAVGEMRLSRASMAPMGLTPGAGIIHALSPRECGLARTADIAAYLADEAAGQCGPCRFGLPRIADLLYRLAAGGAGPESLNETRQMLGLVAGRGACRHPDGSVRMLRSALDVFGYDIALHERGLCEAA